MVNQRLSVPISWDRRGLRAVGFQGFMPFSQLAGDAVPLLPGVYVVLRTASAPVQLLEQTAARSGAAYPLADLTARWIDATPVIYIGKAQARSGGLRTRLGQYARRGSSHRGGRSIWQLADHDQLLVAWAPTPGESPIDVETRYLAEFVDVFGGLPFANRRR